MVSEPLAIRLPGLSRLAAVTVKPEPTIRCVLVELPGVVTWPEPWMS